MPDGDRYGRLRRSYNTAYKKLCEGKFPPDDVAFSVLNRLGGDLRGCASEICGALERLAETLSIVRSKASCGLDVDWIGETHSVTDATRVIAADRTIRTVIELSGKQILNEIRSCDNTSDVQARLFDCFFRRMYSARFADALPVSEAHFGGASPADIALRLRLIDRNIETGLKSFTEQLKEQGLATRFRVAQPENSKPPTLDEIIA